MPTLRSALFHICGCLRLADALALSCASKTMQYDTALAVTRVKLRDPNGPVRD